jgi:hypothetical protein
VFRHCLRPLLAQVVSHTTNLQPFFLSIVAVLADGSVVGLFHFFL